MTNGATATVLYNTIMKGGWDEGLLPFPDYDTETDYTSSYAYAYNDMEVPEKTPGKSVYIGFWITRIDSRPHELRFYEDGSWSMREDSFDFPTFGTYELNSDSVTMNDMNGDLLYTAVIEDDCLLMTDPSNGETLSWTLYTNG